MIGLTISHYLITAKLGAGGMGEVYLAEDSRLDRKVAIKFLSTELTLNQEATTQLMREARAAAKLDHPNICSIYDVGEADGKTFIVMQYVDGKTLASTIRGTPPKIDEALHIAIQVAEALAEAHSHGVIHRDIKPPNIIISPNRQVKLLDFGIAKTIHDQSLTDTESLTISLPSQSGVIKGTVPYMSPEQARGEVLDARSDTFSFGVVLYETITGLLPFVADSAAATLAAILTQEPAPLARYADNVPGELQRIVTKCLEKDRNRRYQTMRDVVTDLDNCLAAFRLASNEAKADRRPMMNWAQDFSADELELWAEEICTAALELRPEKRPVFFTDACGGNDRLLERAQAKMRISEGWSTTSTEKEGVCRPGDWIHDCFILYQVGQGGAAEVYKAIQASLRRLVAVKVIRNSEHRRLLENEALRASKLHHENIATLYAADFQSDTASVVMEYVEGQTLREELAAKRLGAGYTNEEVKSIIGQVAYALRAAHLKGIVHRDIKPENIMVSPAEGDSTLVKVVDFGIAGVVHAGQWELTGTSGYIAPEQYGGQTADARADIFSLGVILYEMLTGAHPFWGATELETHFNTRTKDPEPLPAWAAENYEHVTLKALHKDPNKRYQSIDDFLADLEESPSQQDLGNPFLSELPRPIRAWLERNSYGFAVAAFSFCLGVIAILLSIVGHAACLKILWQPQSQNISFEMVYGFMIEPNAGLWYLLGTPLCFLAGFGFLQSAFVGISHTKTLSVYVNGHPDRHARPIEKIAEHNRRVFRFLTPAVVLVAIAVVLIPEYLARQNGAIGWVQADLPGSLVAQNYWDLRDQGRVGEIPAVERLCRNCPIVVTHVTNSAGVYSVPSRPLFFIFLAVALSHQISLIFFIIWVALKNGFLFVELSKALPDTRADGLRLYPDFEDTNDYRLGLGQLDNAYNATLVFALLGSSVFLLQGLANVGKGTYFFTGNPNLLWVGQLATLGVTVAIIMFTIFWPTVLFVLLTVRARAAALARLAIEQQDLEKKLRVSPRSTRRDLEDQLDGLRERREIIKRQSLLPLRNRTFRRLVVVSLVFLIIVPIAVAWLDLPGGTSTGSLFLRKINNFSCSLCGNSN